MLNDSHSEDLAAVILCGGRSVRMGVDKANLQLNGETLLQRVCRLTLPVTKPVVVVAAPEQKFSSLPAGVVVVRDLFPGEGPLGAVVTGLRWLQKNAPERWRSMNVWMTTCDAPFVNEYIIRELADRLANAKDKICVSVTHNGRRNPFVAVYRSSILRCAELLFDSGERKAGRLLDGDDMEFVLSSDVESGDDRLLFLKNVNTPGDFEECRRIVETAADTTRSNQEE